MDQIPVKVYKNWALDYEIAILNRPPYWLYTKSKKWFPGVCKNHNIPNAHSYCRL